MTYEMHYLGYGYPTMDQIESEAKKKGFTHSFWASEYGYHDMYNGDTVVVYNCIEDMPKLMQLDAMEYGKEIK